VYSFYVFREYISEIENKLYPDYDHGSYQRVYIELKEEREFT
jgi:hypothetical protein